MADASVVQIFKAIYQDEPKILSEIFTLVVDSPAHLDKIVNSTFRGQTPLTFACQLGRKECIKVLINHGANTLLKNKDNWSPFDEAVSYGDRDIVELIYTAKRKNLSKWFKIKGKRLFVELSKDLKDFSLDMNWQFQSWIPFVSKLCPSDTYKIYKKGTSVRIDTTLVGFESLSWIRGDISIIFKDVPNFGPKLVFIDHQRRLVQQIYPKASTLTPKQIEEDVSLSLNTKILAPPEIDFRALSLTRSQTGIFFKKDLDEQVGSFPTSVWQLQDLQISWKTRTEHLEVIKQMDKLGAKNEKVNNKNTIEKKDENSDEELVKNMSDLLNLDEKTIQELNNNEESKTVETNGKSVKKKGSNIYKSLCKFRLSLPAPNIILDDVENVFDDSLINEPLYFGRPQKMETSSKNVQAKLWMYNSSSPTPPETVPQTSWFSSTSSPDEMKLKPRQEFPLSISNITPLLDLIGMGSNQHIRSLQDFFHVQLPPGFPVKVEIPLGMLPLSAVISFDDIKTCASGIGNDCFVSDDLFHIPEKINGYMDGEVIKDLKE